MHNQKHEIIERPTGRRPGDVKLLIATTNQGKLKEIRALLAGLPVELVTLDRFGAVPPPEELGASFAENARSKALYYAVRAGCATVAEDSGLEIDALGGRPGVESARYGGAETPYPRKFSLLYDALRSIGSSDSPARFVCAVAMAEQNEIVFESRGTIEGRIAPEPKGEGGFGYDPIFFYPPFGCTLAEAGERKQTVSHRARALLDLRRFLDHRLGNGAI